MIRLLLGRLVRHGMVPSVVYSDAEFLPNFLPKQADLSSFELTTLGVFGSTIRLKAGLYSSGQVAMQEVVGSSPIIRFDWLKKCLHIGIS